MTTPPGPKKLQLSFSQKLFFAIVSLLLILQIATSVIAYSASRNNVENTAIENLQTGLRVFQYEFDTHKLYLRGAVETIASDWAFREAVGKSNDATAVSVLNNHRRRIHADIGLYISADGSMFNSTKALNKGIKKQLLNMVHQGEGSNKIMLFDNKLYQFVLSPVKAPITLGWVAMGFTIDDQLASKLSDTTTLGISFILGDNNSSILASSLAAEQKSELQNWLQQGSHNITLLTEKNSAPTNFETEQQNLLLSGQALDKIESKTLYLLLQKSIREPLQQFQRWWQNLLWIFIVLLITAGGIAALVARSITTPLQRLLQAAQNITDGHYQDPVTAEGDDEIGALAKEFNNMQSAVAEREKEIRFRADHDQLTGLLSRDNFITNLQYHVEQPEKPLLAVVEFNLNRFKDINDTLSHDIGDQLLQQIAERLKLSFAHTLIARMGADQFALCCGLDDYQQLQPLSQSISDIFNDPFDACGIAITLKAAQGLALYPDHSHQALELLRMAEIAMYHAKERNLDSSIYETQQDQHSVKRLSLMSELPNAIQTGQMQLFYQPTLSLLGDTPQVVKVECLTRWEHPQHGIIPPDDFISLAEQSGAIADLTNWAIDAALQQCRVWRSHYREIGVAVNISALDLFRGDLPQLVAKLLQKYQLPGQLLTLEITESEIMKDPEHACRLLEEIRNHGVRLSIDDYGTGYSSLAQMKQLPVDELKIDKCFVMDLCHSPDDQAIVRSTIDLGHTIGLSIVAEGVESAEILEQLQSKGCDYAQGYYIAKPLPLKTLDEWLESTPFPVASARPQVIKK